MIRRERMNVLEVLDRVLDKGIVIDARARLALVGIDLVTVEAQVVVTSLETYLKYASDLYDDPAAALRIVYEAMEAWNSHDVERYAALLDTGYVGETYRNPSALHGPGDARRAMDVSPNLHFTVEGALASGDDVLVSWLATRTGPSASKRARRAASPEQVPGCTVTRLRGRKIAHTWSYWDTPN